jgi:hypothetical protein
MKRNCQIPVELYFRNEISSSASSTIKLCKVLEETLKAFESILNPGGKIELPYRWEAPPVSWRGREITEGA